MLYQNQFYPNRKFLLFPENDILVVAQLAASINDAEIKLNIEGAALVGDVKGDCCRFGRLL